MTAPAHTTSAPTPKRDVAELEQELFRLAEIYPDTPLLELPSEVLGVIADIATVHGGDMSPAWRAWRDARAAVRARAKE